MKRNWDDVAKDYAIGLANSKTAGDEQ